ncbi:uncharacterized protein PSFLO_03624 [Pseudozyma flocculosa]|uniref:Glycoside hydrolase n=1 Tax=Pseudozyma flocculosa TaxID=84751 RepID=A0A5C3F397_9BASI|nr:uncharacterized protein PSFLO_03624 [Pseudozyma flocculosa]
MLKRQRVEIGEDDIASAIRATLQRLRKSHPRPRMVRMGADPRHDDDGRICQLNLNGDWAFSAEAPRTPEERRDIIKLGLDRAGIAPRGARINVPFAHQTLLSSVHKTTAVPAVWYSKAIAYEDTAQLVGEGSQRVLLHFGAVDYEARVWVNGCQVAHHIGGHVGFSADIRAELDISLTSKEAAIVVVEARDSPQDLRQPRGKQYWKQDEHGNAAPESIFYTPTTGIWQTVWLEAVPGPHISHVATTPDIDSGTVRVDVDLQGLEHGPDRGWIKVEASLHGFRPSLYSKDVLPPEVHRDAWDDGLALWSPEHPTLYDLTVSYTLDPEGGVPMLIDKIFTYVGMRKVSVDDSGRLCLNHRPYFQKLLLDQGYWPKSGMTAPSEDAFQVDITRAKELGFNGCRKHQKVEDPRFFFEADRLGFLVWGEMANAYEYSAKYVGRFIAEWMEVIRRDFSHPCIVAWVPVNESWGVPALGVSAQQRAHLASLHHLTKSLDPTRPVVDNDGWEHVCTDLITIHDYRPAADLAASYADRAAALREKVLGHPIFVAGPTAAPSTSSSKLPLPLPILVTEYGGLAVKGGAAGWGYSEAADQAQFLDQFGQLTAALVAGGVVQGFCYTQLADVEQEVNGLLTAERRHKLDPSAVKAILDRIKPPSA